jgi:hypothetical protein
MTITNLEDRVEGLISDLDELTWVPQEALTDIRNKLEDVSDLLCEAESEYGDEPIEEDDEIEDE